MKQVLYLSFEQRRAMEERKIRTIILLESNQCTMKSIRFVVLHQILHILKLVVRKNTDSFSNPLVVCMGEANNEILYMGQANNEM